MRMRNRALGASVGAWIGEEADLTNSLAQLDSEKPGWDDGVRLIGVVRRLERDPTANGIQAAIDVYGKDSVYEALPCAGLKVVDDVVVGLDDQPVYTPSSDEPRNVSLSGRNKEFEFSSGAKLSARETEILLAVAKGVTTQDIASRLGLSLQTVKNRLSIVMKKVRAVDVRQDGVADAGKRIHIEEKGVGKQ